jgi:hypothetical protein
MKRSNVLIQIAEDSLVDEGVIPEKKETIVFVQYDELSKNPYRYTEDEFQQQVHYVRRGKKGLKIDKYDLRRSRLCKEYGWGIHIDRVGRVALVGCETQKYRDLGKNPLVNKVKAYRRKK